MGHLSKLRAVEGVLCLHSNDLKSLHGLHNLRVVKTAFWNYAPRTISIHGNPCLVDIEAISGVSSDDGYLILYSDDVSQYCRRPEKNSDFHRNILQIVQGPALKPLHTHAWTEKVHHDYSGFGRSTHNKNLNYLQDLEVESDTLVLSFSELNGNLGGLFYNRFPLLVDGVNTHKLFLRDPTRRWFHGGIPGLSKNIQGTVDYFCHIAEAHRYRRIICIGISAGAYMSLLVGHQIGATDILLFAPQTFIDPENREKAGDTRWQDYLDRLPKDVPMKYLDLAELYRQKPKVSARIHVHYGADECMDAAHVRHLAEVVEMKQFAYPVNDHMISIYLDRKLGMLNEIVARFIRIVDEPALTTFSGIG